MKLPFMKEKTKNVEKTYLNAETFVQLFCGLIIPRIRDGKDIETAWDEIKDYFEDFQFKHEKVCFSKGLKYNFEELINAYKELYYEESPVFLNLLQVFKEYHDSEKQILADQLTIYQVMNTRVPYSTESYFPNTK
ncbi:hypothetical protein [Bacillus thuringiensis]|uniref:hypothetical protein n=1 Tax=Bacillus thuringiensis TaxID=1428 RepID=UPI0021D694B8|nr:hypothetical protein [Bacillus thuringiensis]MCU7679315.1 hypothetical protein [Bacillus thuringiensis]